MAPGAWRRRPGCAPSPTRSPLQTFGLVWRAATSTILLRAAIAPLTADAAYLDPLPLDAPPGPRARAERLDALLVARAGAGAIVRAAVEPGLDVARASDHQPVVLDLRLP
jgi:endonuclease/exonuclease/phosphatase family metal-dependent hydrolase